LIPPDFLARLRCPLAPAAAAVGLEDAGDALVCRGCRVRFPAWEGIPSLLPEEAELPAGCKAMEDLPCRRG
jgi:uncharacterized protein YbaR (Trm112 family)